MFDLFWLTDAQMTRLEPYLPKPYGKPRVDDRRILSDRCPEVFLSVIDLAALAIYWQCVMSLKLPFVPSSESVILGSKRQLAATAPMSAMVARRYFSILISGAKVLACMILI